MANQRVNQLRQFLTKNGLESVLISNPINVQYFSGFIGEGHLYITADNLILLTDFRYIEQAEQQAPEFTIVKQSGNVMQAIAGVIDSGTKVGLEANYITLEFFEKLQQQISAHFISVALDDLRMIKDEHELALIHKAVKISDAAFSHVLPLIKPGVRESDIALELEFFMRRLGAQKIAFETIVASGARSALPHGVASDKVIAAGDFVTMDFGAVYQGYHSDITRTVIVGKATRKQREIYEIVLDAQLAGVQAVCSGKTGTEVDAVARDIIASKGYGDYFGHGLGHGVGLMIHEGPRLSPLGGAMLEPNMVVTVEPGIYLPQWGGVRIEDTVVVSATCGKILTASSKQLIEVDW